MDLQELMDREEIRCLQNAYNIGGDRGRIDELAGVFTPDGTLTSRGGTAVGPAAIQAQMTKSGPRPTEGPDRKMDFVRHNLTTSRVDFDSPTDARGRTYFMVYSEIGPDHMGVYVDRYKKIDGAWKIAERKVRIDWVAEGGHSIKSRVSD